MSKSLSLAALSVAILAVGCTDQRFKKAKDGSEYKIIRNENAAKAIKGNFIELNIVAKYKDSVLFSSVESSAPRFIPYDTASLPPFYKQVYEGDSLVIRQSTDSIMKAGQGAPWMQKGQYIFQSFKVVKIFNNKESADSVAKTFEATARIKAYKKASENIEKEIAKNADLAKQDDKIITDYLTKNNIKANKTPWGTYVSITTPGTGPNLTENDVAVINYTGKTFKDTTFDSNTDKKFNHVEPLDVDMGEFRLIPGWLDGLKLMQKGSKGKLIIPSYLAYGKNGAPPKIAPDENLVFDIEVTDVLTQDQFQKEREAKQKMMQMQQQMMQQQMQQQRQHPQQPPAEPKK
ncbi:MAG: FKBP-type peptidyl-prolyl cis-trans isomerase [Ginsengibacter sp.]